MSDEQRSAPLAAASYHDDDVVARIVAAKVIDREMLCPDDHWNDEYATRPDAAWLASYHNNDDAVEFCGRPYQLDKERWINAYLEAEGQVIELRASGHARARAILDLPYEMAFTCDDCRLWAFVGHRDAKDSFSEEERHGPLFTVRSCDKLAVSKVHRKPFDPNTAWEREPIIYEQEVSGADLRSKVRKVYADDYNDRRRARYAAKKEERDAATTKEHRG